MARDGSGNYVLPVGNPVVPNTTITAAQFNSNMNDLASALTQSLPRDGQAGMTGPFRLADGTIPLPAFAFNSEAGTGISRPASGIMAFSVTGTERARFVNGNFLVGTSTDGGQKFQVAGTASVSGDTTLGANATVTGNLTVNGTLTATGTITGIDKSDVGLGNVDNTSDVNKPISTAVQAALDVITSARRGTISPIAYSGVPTGALVCNGQAVSRATYAALFALIGTTWGAGDGSTTFNVPDFRGVALRGTDEGRGLDASRAFASYQADLFASHAHGVNDPAHAHSISDPTHSHGAHSDVQGYHGHGVSDPGHSHSYSGPNGNTTTGGGAAFCSGAMVGNGTGTGYTGISINGDGNHAHNIWTDGAYTGIGINGAYTGISIQANGGAETRMKNTAVRYVIWY